MKKILKMIIIYAVVNMMVAEVFALVMAFTLTFVAFGDLLINLGNEMWFPPNSLSYVIIPLFIRLLVFIVVPIMIILIIFVGFPFLAAQAGTTLASRGGFLMKNAAKKIGMSGFSQSGVQGMVKKGLKGLGGLEGRQLKSLGRSARFMGAKKLGRGLHGLGTAKGAYEDLVNANNKKNRGKLDEENAKLLDYGTMSKRELDDRSRLGDKRAKQESLRRLDEKRKTDRFGGSFGGGAAAAADSASHRDENKNSSENSKDKSSQQKDDKGRPASKSKAEYEKMGESALKKNASAGDPMARDELSRRAANLDSDRRPDNGSTIEDLNNNDREARNTADTYRETHTTHDANKSQGVAGHEQMDRTLDTSRTNKEMKQATLNGEKAQSGPEAQVASEEKRVEIASDANGLPVHEDVAKAGARSANQKLKELAESAPGMPTGTTKIEGTEPREAIIHRGDDGSAQPSFVHDDVQRAGEVLATGSTAYGTILPKEVSDSGNLSDENIKAASARKNASLSDESTGSSSTGLVAGSDHIDSGVSTTAVGRAESSGGQNIFNSTGDQSEYMGSSQPGISPSKEEIPVERGVRESIQESEAYRTFDTERPSPTIASDHGGSSVIDSVQRQLDEQYAPSSNDAGQSSMGSSVSAPTSHSVGSSQEYQPAFSDGTPLPPEPNEFNEQVPRNPQEQSQYVPEYHPVSSEGVQAPNHDAGMSGRNEYTQQAFPVDGSGSRSDNYDSSQPYREDRSQHLSDSHDNPFPEDSIGIREQGQIYAQNPGNTTYLDPGYQGQGYQGSGQVYNPYPDTGQSPNIDNPDFFQDRPGSNSVHNVTASDSLDYDRGTTDVSNASDYTRNATDTSMTQGYNPGTENLIFDAVSSAVAGFAGAAAGSSMMRDEPQNMRFTPDTLDMMRDLQRETFDQMRSEGMFNAHDRSSWSPSLTERYETTKEKIIQDVRPKNNEAGGVNEHDSGFLDDLDAALQDAMRKASERAIREDEEINERTRNLKKRGNDGKMYKD